MFKALTAEQTLDRFETDGLSVRAANDPKALQRIMPLDEFSPVIRQSAMKALPAYLAFFCLENAVRELVVERMQEHYGSDWWDKCAPNGMKRSVSDRKEKEGSNRWHIERGAHEIYYINFGDLKSLIQNNWAVFQDLFPDQNWVFTRLDELEASRNIIAHSNTLDDREMLRIRLYLQDWVRQVG